MIALIALRAEPGGSNAAAYPVSIGTCSDRWQRIPLGRQSEYENTSLKDVHGAGAGDV